MRIILVSSGAEAEQVLAELRKGADFVQLAKQKSIDPTADSGGDLGTVKISNLQADLQNAIEHLAPGQFSNVIELSTGYAIVQLVSAADPGGQSTLGPAGMLPTAGRGNIRNPTDVSGAVDVDIAFRKMPKPPGWERNPVQACVLRKKSLLTAISWLEQVSRGEGAPAEWKPADLLEAHDAAAQLLAYEGKMPEAIQHWLAAYDIAKASVPDMVSHLQEVLSIAYFHKSEMENGIYRKPGERCLFPPHPSGFRSPLDSRKSIEYAEQYLAKKPDDLEVKWLLNLAYMTLGQYPKGVPAKFRIADSAFSSKAGIGRFRDVAPLAGLDLVSMAGGIIVDDFDNDGQLDVVTSSYDMCDHLHFFHNLGDGTFVDVSESAGLMQQLGGLNIIQADYNNDGCLDILVLRGAWQFPMRPSLLKNNCDGTFSDVTEASGLASSIAETQTAAWADIDNDGWLDLFIGNEQGPALLFHNKRDGTFEDISHSAGIDRVAPTKGVVAADYDNDGYPDFYVSNIGGDNFLYHNNRNLTFTETAQSAGVQEPWTSFATWFFDYDNDGWPDLFVTSYSISVDETLRSYLGLPRNAETMKLYRNLGNGAFKDVTEEVGLDRVFMTMGANFGDVDNDGFLDFYLATGNPSYGSLVPNALFHNDRGKRFVDVTASSGTGELHKGHGVAFADVERNGNEDLFAETGGATPADAHALRLFQNPGHQNDWINLKLAGVKTNRAAIGARIQVTVENAGQGVRSIYRTVGSGGSFGASPLEQHIGLGKAARIQKIEIWWPASNTRQVFTNVEKDQFLQIKELDKEYTRLDRKTFKFGGSRPAAPTPTASSSQKQ